MGKTATKIWKAVYQKTTGVALIIAVLTVFLTATTAETQVSTINPIEETRVFDPICIGEHDLNFDYDSFCTKWTWVDPMGVSANIEQKNVNDNHARVLFIKINATEIPTSNPLTTTSISKADLVLKVRYEPAINGIVDQIPFYTMNKKCHDVNWTESTDATDLPCINNSTKHSVGDQTSFDALNPEWIDDVTFDLKTHIRDAKKQKIDIFTELITFYPVTISNDNFDSKTKECIQKISDEAFNHGLNDGFNYTELDKCLESFRISVYGPTNLSEGVRPQLALEYTTKPTPVITAVIAIMAASIPIIGGVVQAQYKSIRDKKEKDEKDEKAHALKMNTLHETLKQEIIAIKTGFTDKDSEGNVLNRFPKKNNFVFNNFSTGDLIFKFSLDKEHYVSFVKSPKDAFQGIVNSGSFEEFDQEKQTAITELYEFVNAYEDYLEKTENLAHEMKIKSSDSSFGDTSKAYQSIITKNLNYLSKKRNDIISKIEHVLELMKNKKPKPNNKEEVN